MKVGTKRNHYEKKNDIVDDCQHHVDRQNTVWIETKHIKMESFKLMPLFSK